MNKIIIPIIVVLVVAAGIGVFFVSRKPSPDAPITPISCPQITPPSPQMEEECEKDGGKLEPKKNEQGCVIGHECKKVVACIENWQCGDWSTCQDGKQTRTCTDENSCETTANKPTESQNCESLATEIKSLSLLKKVEIANGARPEIIVTKDRVFIVYLETLMTGNSFKVKIYDRDLTAEIASKTLVTKSASYGNPTDIRVVSDGTYLYAFYETFGNNESFLWGAKYILDDVFERVAYIGPITQGVFFKNAKEGDEKPDDPAPMLEGDNVYVMTRFKSTLAKEGYTKFKIYKYDKNLNKQSEFDLDLSAYADGEARQSSIIYDNGYYYIAMQTTTGSGDIVETVEWTVPQDVLMVKLDKNWKVVESKIIANEQGCTEGYVTGLKSDDKYFYITYNQVMLDNEFSSIIKIFDKNWKTVLTEKYRTANNAKGGGLRPSIEITKDRIYAGNSEGGTQKADIYIFEKK